MSESTTTPTDYDAACRRAATAQGLDPITEALRAAGLHPDVQQTGGFVMAVVVPLGDRAYVVTWVSEDDARPWLLGTYTAGGWANGDEALDMRADLSTDEVVEALCAAAAGATA